MNKRFLTTALVVIAACGCGKGKRAFAADYSVQDLTVATDNQGDSAVVDDSLTIDTPVSDDTQDAATDVQA